MVVLAPGSEMGRTRFRDRSERVERRDSYGVHGQVVRGGQVARGASWTFLVRRMLELRLQVEELRRRLDEERRDQNSWVGEVHPPALASGNSIGAIEPPDQPAPPSTLTLSPGMTMAEIERAAIEAALKDTRGNRRKAAEILDIVSGRFTGSSATMESRPRRLPLSPESCPDMKQGPAGRERLRSECSLAQVIGTAA